MDQRLAELVGRAMLYVPTGLLDLVQVDWFLGSDPVFAGLHRFDKSATGVALHGAGAAPHYAYAETQLHRPRAARVPTIVFPAVDHHWYDHHAWWLIHAVLHEFGHAVQDASEANLRTTWWADPVSEYAKTSHREAYADAFSDWRCGYYDHRVLADRATVARFELITRRS